MRVLEKASMRHSKFGRFHLPREVLCISYENGCKLSKSTLKLVNCKKGALITILIVIHNPDVIKLYHSVQP